MADSVFSKIIAGEIPCHRIYEDDHVLAFLDINPLAEGHTLVVPKQPAARLEELESDELAAVARCLGQVARRVLAATQVADYSILQNNGPGAGQEVPHVHFHIIPRRPNDGLGYRWAPTRPTPEELEATAARINAVSA